MKVNVSVEATAQEMREFLGLPNVQPLHDDMMQALRGGDVTALAGALHNDLQAAALSLRPELGDVLAAGLAVAGLLLRSIGFAPGTDWVDRWVLGQGLLGDVVFVAMGAAATAAGVPRQGVAFLGGYAFDLVKVARKKAREVLGDA